MTPVSFGIPPGVPPECRDRRVEIARLEWRIGDPGDPAAIVDDFCRDLGMPVEELSKPLTHTATVGELCGVAVLISAAAGSAMIGGALGRPSPVGRVPDVVLVAYAHTNTASTTVMPDSRPIVGPWTASWTSTEHAAAVSAVREAIGRGDVYQANVVGHQSAPTIGDPNAIAAAVASLEPTTYSGGLGGDGWLVASASPECLVSLDLGRVTTRPIKGTAPATAEGAEFLRSSVKERAEHVMIVDLERNDLAHVAVPGSISVPELFALRRWCGLWQAESTIEAEVRPGTRLSDLLRAVCPPGSVTGTPKLAALDHIAALEPVGRGPAMGALGYLTVAGLVLGLTIRTVAVADDRVHLWTGGGITWRSEPTAEVAEAAAKAAPIKAILASQG
ncbi:chorismate-binding protein [Stackebrandtia soli]|uniref:chorismate-binding protein n=1 Tax=Stackebrandtia soli TaxID=1892856 RepID=UPI0039ECF97E